MGVLARGPGAATSGDEIPLFLPGDGGTALFGVVTIPPSRPRGIGILFLPGGGVAGSTYRNDMAVRMCRRFAGLGFHAMRFDWHGVGDSTGWVARFSPEAPFVADVLAASAALRDLGVDRLLIVGSCFGARTGLAAARDLPGLEAMFLVAPPVAVRRRRDPGARMANEWSVVDAVRRGFRPAVFRGLLDPRRRRTIVQFWRAKSRTAIGKRSSQEATERSAWLSERFITSLEGTSQLGIGIHLLYGERDSYLEDLAEARRDRRLVALIAEGRVVVEVIPGELHGYQRVAAQELVAARVDVWVQEHALRVVKGTALRPAGVPNMDIIDPSASPGLGDMSHPAGTADA